MTSRHADFAWSRAVSPLARALVSHRFASAGSAAAGSPPARARPPLSDDAGLLVGGPAAPRGSDPESHSSTSFQ